ncbi:LacI family DNA-binding transcriptional regulator [Paenibacillus xerothermodurans]|uniref:LacI family transcriptional regulator n=1 Tax=Paenibacillus xerothermodurans TaxID=1977292 RepID=A0A2W1N8Q1_PAEXE|nr:LacI family DNA-binding transcriptional regulator [Paenibacillus xerothermodurans]PZE20030.1 LacI family transcriptional regulator [Paenibacillus xerothermodurans]
MTVKLKDVAERAGVSLTTVSRLLKEQDQISVSKETEDRIWTAIRELGYDLSRGKRGSKKPLKKLRKVGYILQITKEKFEDTFFSKIIHGIEQEIISQRYELGFAYTVPDLEDPVILRRVLNSEADGLIFIGSIPNDLLQTLVGRIPNCVATLAVPGQHQIDCITIDYEKSFYQLVRQLIQAGHRDIAFFGGKSYGVSPEERAGSFFDKQDERFQGYLKALLESGIPIRDEIIKDGNWELDTAYRKMTDMLQSGTKITAVAASNDRMAIGAMRAIQERGLKIPEEISVTGFDDIEMAQFVFPPLTTITYHKEEIGRLAVRLLTENMQPQNRIAAAKKIVLPAAIVGRESAKTILQPHVKLPD